METKKKQPSKPRTRVRQAPLQTDTTKQEATDAEQKQSVMYKICTHVLDAAVQPVAQRKGIAMATTPDAAAAAGERPLPPHGNPVTARPSVMRAVSAAASSHSGRPTDRGAAAGTDSHGAALVVAEPLARRPSVVMHTRTSPTQSTSNNTTTTKKAHICTRTTSPIQCPTATLCSVAAPIITPTPPTPRPPPHVLPPARPPSPPPQAPPPPLMCSSTSGRGSRQSPSQSPPPLGCGQWK